MDLMTLAAKIVLDDSSYTSGVAKAEKMGEQLAGKMSAMTVAVGNLAADAIKRAVSAVGNVVTSAIDGYADYEQLIGGVETLFKTSADKVAKYAKQSFKTTGLSANDYMETVTSFSASLIQGLGGDTEKAAEMANTAVTDMADNANKMGTDIGAIQSAYQGFAKQNYTMLDNLKLGYGGTAGEMVRLINDSKILDHEISDLDNITFDQIVAAIHQIQTDMGVAGTTASEAASTISGSKESMKAAWKDFLSAVAGEGGEKRLDETKANFEKSFKTYVNNLAPVLQTAVENAPTLIDAVVGAITSITPKAAAKLVEGGLATFVSLVSGAADLAGWFVDGLVQFFTDINADPSQIAELGNAIGTFIGSALADIVTNSPTIISGLFTAGVTLASSLIEGIFSGLMGTDEGVYGVINEANDEMMDGIKEAEQSSLKAKGIIDYMDSLIDKYGKMAFESTEWKNAVAALEEVLPGANQLIINQGSDLDKAITKLKEYNKQMKETAIEEAKRQALQTKQDALINAQAQLLSTQSEIYIKENEAKAARDEMIDFIRQSGQKDYTGEGKTREQLVYDAYASLNDMFENGAGDEGYTEAATKLASWESTLTTSEDEVNKLKGTLAELEKQVQFAETQYITSAAAMEKLTNTVGSATQALALIKNPEMGMSSGEYYNWQYSHKHATGIDFVPTNNWKAELHRGEAVLTASENEARRNGYGTAEVVGAIQEMRQDLQNMKLVVGQKTFGRAVVDYSGRRTREYIGQAESRDLAGYGT